MDARNLPKSAVRKSPYEPEVLGRARLNRVRALAASEGVGPRVDPTAYPATPVPLHNLPGHEEPGAFLAHMGRRRGTTLPRRGFLTRRTGFCRLSLAIIHRKTVNFDSSSPPMAPLNIPCPCPNFGLFPWREAVWARAVFTVTALGDCQGRIAAARDPIGIADVQRRGGIGTTGFRIRQGWRNDKKAPQETPPPVIHSGRVWAASR